MKDKLTYGFVESVLDSKFTEVIKLLFKIVYFVSYYYCIYCLIKYFFTDSNYRTASEACRAGFSGFYYWFFLIIITACYLLGISHFSKYIKHKNLYYKLIIIPAILVAISSYFYI